MGQVFYPFYALWIAIYAVIFAFFGGAFAKMLDSLFPKLDTKKSKLYLLGETSLQLALNCIVFYAMREYIHDFMMLFFSLKTTLYGKPAKFAALIISPIVFLVQTELMLKIAYIWDVNDIFMLPSPI